MACGGMQMNITEIRIATRPDGLVSIALMAPDQTSDPAPVHATFHVHDAVARMWAADVPCSWRDGAFRAEAQIEVLASAELIELTGVRTQQQEQLAIPVDTFFVPGVGDRWEQGERAQQKLQALVAERKAHAATPVRANDAATSQFGVLILVENIHLTEAQIVPGLSVLPLRSSTLGSEIPAVLNSVLGQLGWSEGISAEAWADATRAYNPAAVVHAPCVIADDPEQAGEHVRELAIDLLNLVAFRRGDAPRIVASAVGTVANGRVSETAFRPEGPGYRGNLLGGFVSGEDPHSLLVQWDAAQRDRRVAFWLSLHASALAEPRWEFRLFRCFSLLEAIGSEVIPSSTPAVDPEGNPRLQDNGKPYTTDHGRVKVHDLLVRVARATERAEGSFVSQVAGTVAPALWEEVGLWLRIRNQVAHGGAWPDPLLVTPKVARIEAQLVERSPDRATVRLGAEATVDAIRRSVEATIIAGIRGRLSSFQNNRGSAATRTGDHVQGPGSHAV